MKRFQQRRGFTLIELIVILVILAILAAAGLPVLNGYIQKAREATAISECGTVVRTAQAKAVELLAFGVLKELPIKTDSIMETCGLSGDLLGVRADTVSGTVSYLLYQAANGPLVQYKAGDDPKFTIVDKGEGGDSPPLSTGPMEVLISNTKDHMAVSPPGKREDLANWVMQEENRVQVGDECLQDWPSSSRAPFYWRPYYLGSPKDNILFLYAAPGGGSTSWNGWSSYLFYIDGKVYRRSDGKAMGIAGFNTCKTLVDVEARVIAEGFVLVDG